MHSLTGILSGIEENTLARFQVINQREKDIIIELEQGSYSEDAMQIGRPIILKVFDPSRGLCVYRADIEYLISNRLHLSNLKADSLIQRRLDVKVFMNFETYAIHSFINENQIKVRRKVLVKLRDLSAGGICFTTNMDFSPDDDYEFVFDRGRTPVVIKFIILRKMDNANGGFRYGCKFVDMTNVEEQIIREFVFKRQLT